MTVLIPAMIVSWIAGDPPADRSTTEAEDAAMGLGPDDASPWRMVEYLSG
ncbi:MAG: hypothetical protein R2860_01350 [Desulfobacterales bacterium]